MTRKPVNKPFTVNRRSTLPHLQTGHIEPARANASPSRSTAKGDEKVSHKTYTQEEYKYLIRYTLGLSKPTGNVGQHAKNNSEGD